MPQLENHAITFTSEEAAVLMVAQATQQLGITESNGWTFDILLSPDGKVRFVVTFTSPTVEPPSAPALLLEAHPIEEPDVL